MFVYLVELPHVLWIDQSRPILLVDVLHCHQTDAYKRLRSSFCWRNPIGRMDGSLHHTRRKIGTKQINYWWSKKKKTNKLLLCCLVYTKCILDRLGPTIEFIINRISEANFIFHGCCRILQFSERNHSQGWGLCRPTFRSIHMQLRRPITFPNPTQMIEFVQHIFKSLYK